MEFDFGTLKSDKEINLEKLPLEIEFPDNEGSALAFVRFCFLKLKQTDEPLGIYCMDHQEARQNKIKFVKKVAENTYHLIWTG